MGKMTKATPIESIDVFQKFGDKFEKIYADDVRHIYIFQRTNIETGVIYYETIKAQKNTYPDGTVIYSYPSSEKFGQLGYCTNAKRPDLEKRIKMYIEKLKGN